MSSVSTGTTMQLSLTKCGARIGAVVDGFRLGPDMTAGEVAFIQDALADHGVLFFRNQSLSETEQIAVADLLGGAAPFPLTALLRPDVPLVGRIEDKDGSPPDADGWHTDITWTAEPPAYAVLQAILIPAWGGDTMWVSLEAVYDALSEPMRRLCDGLTAFHAPGERFIAANRRIFSSEVADRIAEAFPGVSHPLVRTHPRTGRRSLFWSSFIQHIEGVTEPENRMLCDHIMGLLSDPNFQVRWRWSVGDVAIWDEANTNHRALSDHFAFGTQHRIMQRATVRGTRPFFTPAG